MRKKFSEFFETKAGKVVGGLFGAVAVLTCIYLLYNAILGPDTTESLSSGRVFIDSTTGKTFNYTIKIGDIIPVTAPSGGKTGYPTEACFWTADGKVKTDPTYVLLNATLGKTGPTFCPDCHRLVVQSNPPPVPGDKPPISESEYKNRH